jgi:hypothetical protein
MTERPTNAQLFADAGRALYGEAWQSPLARKLQISLRSVQYIAAAAEAGRAYRIAPGVMAELAEMLRDRSRDCTAIAAQIGAL